MKKTIIVIGIVLLNLAMGSCSADSILGESHLDEVQANGDQGGGNGTGSTPIKPPPPPPVDEP